MKIKTLTISLIISAFCLSSIAHQDRILELKENKLIGLPTQYQPATFSYQTRSLSIGKNSVVIPESIWSLFGDIKQDPIIFTASWYHDGDLPHYLYVKNRNCEFLINLQTLEIIEFLKDKQISSELSKEWKVTKK